MSATRSLSVIVPAYREAANILGTLEQVYGAFGELDLDGEVIVIDDGSDDGTARIVLERAAHLPGLRLLVNDRNRGFGWTYRRGVDAATRDAIVMVHGDNAWGADTLRDLFRRVGEADIIIGYTRDMWRSRPWARTVISKTFTATVNVLTGRRLRYYNGLQIHRAAILKSLQIQSSGYGFQAEVLVKALRLSTSYVEVPMVLREREAGESKAFRMKNVVDVVRTLRLLRSLDRRVASQ